MILTEGEIKELRNPYERKTGKWVLQYDFASFVAIAQARKIVEEYDRLKAKVPGNSTEDAIMLGGRVISLMESLRKEVEDAK